MDTLLLFLLVGTVLLLLKHMFPSSRESEYMLVSIERPQESIGCLPIVVIALLFLLVSVVLLSEGQCWLSPWQLGCSPS